jgi:hypothetical protein
MAMVKLWQYEERLSMNRDRRLANISSKGEREALAMQAQTKRRGEERRESKGREGERWQTAIINWTIIVCFLVTNGRTVDKGRQVEDKRDTRINYREPKFVLFQLLLVVLCWVASLWDFAALIFSRISLWRPWGRRVVATISWVRGQRGNRQADIER